MNEEKIQAAGVNAEFSAYLELERRFVDLGLRRYLPSEELPPHTIHKAMHYSVFAGGKRLRPILLLSAGRTVGGEAERLLPAACAVEMIHTYSLMHDDLPALDNDDLRRGRPTSHRVFGEAMAILAGDALLTRAFEILTLFPEGAEMAPIRVRVLQILAAACGTGGMIGGQVADLESEGLPVNEELVRTIHDGKTGALIRASVQAGAVLAAASDEQITLLDRYARAVGLAFQIMDDVLDIVESSTALGKTAGKDTQQRKATWPAMWGVDVSRRKARELVDEAIAAIAVFGPEARRLRQIAEFVCERHH